VLKKKEKRMKNNVVENKKTEAISIVVVFVIMVLLNIGLSKLINVLFEKGVDIPLIVYGTLIEVAIMIPAIVYIKMKGENLLESLGFHKVKITTILLAVLLTILSMPLYMCANVLSQIFVPNTVVQASSQLLSGSLLASWFVMTIAAPICEEVAIRGFCFNRFRRITSLLIATLVSAVMFGIIHLNINQMCYAIVLGVVFALANFASGSIWTSITMHFIVNNIGLLTIAAVNAATEAAGASLAEDAEAIRTGGNTMLTTGIVLLVISIGFSFLIRKVLRKIAQNENNQEAIELFGGKKEKEVA
jgi:membrane protease YdiL (CAAX protease family)